MINRKRTRQIRVGDVRIGGGAAISIQSMTKVETSDIRACISQIKALEDAGCEIVRVAVKTLKDALGIKDIKRAIKIPLVADIHFNYRLALTAIKSGADKIRLNPGNIRKREEIAQVARAAKKAHIPIRIGVNSGSVNTVKGDRLLFLKEAYKKSSLSPLFSAGSALTNSALSCIKIFEVMDFHDIIISLKASDVVKTVEAYREIAGLCDYPLHLGVTASGPCDSGIVKSSIGIGALLLDGIGDTIRVSLTADPVEEVIAAKRILSSLGLRQFGPEIISCPTCGRCQIDLAGIVKDLEHKLSAIRYPLNAGRKLSIALMGCEVNGPGEAKEADVGIAFGKNFGMLFEKGKILKKISVSNAVKELLKLI
ncbi:MAG: flavodoxin-dependent (E)-4-hydroxy-3-methylbut-2-enyl-diphosphate synthase [Candidatus Omnitrophota bacterium]|nr:flavodoxin-dependent (E)-4-hydroxy-3-methylbut-2-enyl-diphosphate synthase [Candidatus Omnitrophota bacterium]